ncbi:MAG: radical SAM protein [Anaeromyxobacteraceae bacterium]
MSTASTGSTGELKKKLWHELKVKTDVVTDGVAVDSDALSALRLGQKVKEQIHCLFVMDFEPHEGDLPSEFVTPNGLDVPVRWNPRSRYRLALDGERFILAEGANEVFEVSFHPRPGFYDRKTSDGKPMQTIAIANPDGHIFIVYSNECSYKDRGEDCLFCNINETKNVFNDKYGTQWKTPGQIGETVAAAKQEGLFKHLTVTGGVIPERRELDYYLDVAEAIRERTGEDQFNGTATVAAPLDLGNLDRFKEAGFRTTAMNLEIWDKRIYEVICPGKARSSGGWDHWVKALEHGVRVFGHGRVRSNFVAGIEPKARTVEGLEVLAGKGVVSTFTVWCPNPGSELRGHRAPEPGWYLDLAEKLVGFWKKHGITFEHVFDSNAATNGIQHDLYRIEDELLPVFHAKRDAQPEPKERRAS